MIKLYAKIKMGLFCLLCFGISSQAVALQQQGNPCNASAKYLYWTGEDDDDFFNENNWRETNQKPADPTIPYEGGGYGNAVKPQCLPGANSNPYTICPNIADPEKDPHPKQGTLDPGKAIDQNLLISGVNVKADGEILFACAEKGLTLFNSTLDAAQGQISQGVISLDGESTVQQGGETFSSLVTINFLDAASWVYLNQINPKEFHANLSHVKINHQPGSLNGDFRINQYYQKGSVIRPLAAGFAPLQVYSGLDFQGAPAGVAEDLIHRGAAIPNGDNTVQSFILKRGFMATFANNPDGTGKSKVYIASEKDLEVEALPAALQGNVSFIRVVPWNWVTKKGTGGFYDQLDAGWFYNWNLNETPKPNYDYVPMAWGAGGASPSSINQMIGKKSITHVLGFNESDNCSGESGQYNNLCQPEVAVAYYENLMGTGVRLGSPAPRENGPTTWLLEFNRIAKQRDVRFDFVAVHWYDWGSNPATSPNADPQVIFNRFKSYLENVHRIYQLPIWITEFNANPNRGNAIQEEFLKLALPYLESLEYVERYAYFQPNPANANPANSPEKSDYLDNGSLTNIGELYLAHESSPSIPEDTYAAPNNLEEMDQPFTPKPVNSLAFEAECGDYLGNKWDVLSDEGASNEFYIRGNTQKEGASPIAKQVHFEFDLASGDQYRVWIRAKSSGPGAIRIAVDGNDLEQISPLTSASFTWFQIPRFYHLGEGTHRLTLEFPNANILVDQVALTNGPTDLEQFVQDAGACTPGELTWGLVKTDLVEFFEAEEAEQGSWWEIKTAANARGGIFTESIDGQVSVETPPASNGVLTFNFELEEADEYEIWSKIQALEGDENSLWISVDGEPFKKWPGLRNELFEWYWKKMFHSYEGEERKFSYFLNAGPHQVRIAVASGNVSVDRIAVTSKGKLPEEIDPNVILVKENLEFEAEHATILGLARVVACGTSSNGQQVELASATANGVRFDQIIAQDAGTYVLNISYMSKTSRSFRISVNGQNLGQKTVAPSGNWCFEGGSPGMHQMEVTLQKGVNTIAINVYNNTPGPIIDKIKLEKAPFSGVSLEAELAEIIGSPIIVACGSASNGQLVNMLLSTANGVKFTGINVPFAGKYLVEIHYLTAVNRNMRYSVNGASFVTDSFQDSGEWCSNGGQTAVKAIEVDFNQGNNTLEFRTTGTDAPFLDKIVAKEPEQVSGGNLRVLETIQSNSSFEAELINREFRVYPNPVIAGNPVTVDLPLLFDEPGEAVIQVTDLTGKVVYSEIVSAGSSQLLDLNRNLARGMYIILVQQGQIWQSKKLIVQ